MAYMDIDLDDNEFDGNDDMGNNSSNITLPTDCSSAVHYTHDVFINTIQILHVIFTIASAILIYINDACDLYVLNLHCFIYRIICYLALLGFSLVHLCLCLERFLAIFYIKTYEKMGPKVGIMLTVFMWIAAIGGILYLFVDSTDTNLWVYYSYCSVLSNWTSGRLLDVFYFLLGLNILVSITDLFLLKLNNFKKYKIKIGVIMYDLSKKFQLNENSFTIKMIIPFALTHSILFTLYLIASIIINRVSKEITDKTLQKVSIESVYLLNSFYIFTMMAVIKLVNGRKQQIQPTIIRKNQTDLYFKMFETQLAGTLGKSHPAKNKF